MLPLQNPEDYFSLQTLINASVILLQLSRVKITAYCYEGLKFMDTPVSMVVNFNLVIKVIGSYCQRQ